MDLAVLVSRSNLNVKCDDRLFRIPSCCVQGEYMYNQRTDAWTCGWQDPRDY